MALINRRSVLYLCVLDVVLFIISFSLDVSVHSGLTTSQGIWCGLFYLVAGILGLIVVFYKQDQPIIKATLAVACLAVLFGLVAAGLSGKKASDLTSFCSASGSGTFNILTNFCNDRFILWALMITSILALIFNAVLAYFLYPNINTATAA